jgi:hypothetical protein
VTAALHRFGPARTVLPQIAWIVRSILDQMDKTLPSNIHKSLIHKNLSAWHAACKELRNPATGVLS